MSPLVRRPSLPAGSPMRRVIVAYGLTAFIEFATWMAIVLVGYAQGGAVLAGVASLAMYLPAFLLIPLLAAVGERFSMARSLQATHAAGGLASLATGALLLADAPYATVLVGGALITTAVRLARPFHFAAIPRLAQRPGDIVAANGISSFLDGVALFAGCIVGAALADAVGAWSALIGSGVLGVAAGALCMSLGPAVAERPTAPSDHDAGHLRAALEGLSVVRGNFAILALFGLIASTTVVEGANEVLNVVFNDQVLGMSDATAGLLVGMFGIGMAAGGVGLAGAARVRRLAPLVLAGALLLGIAEALMVFVYAPWQALALLTCTGIGVAMILMSARTLLQRSMEDGVLARVMAVHEGMYMLGLVFGAVLGPLLVDLLGPRGAYVPFGAAVAMVALVAYRHLMVLDATADARQREVDLLSGVPFLAALPPYELQRLAQGAALRSVGAGTAVVRQGDPGEAYFLVASGRLAVTIDGKVSDHELLPGDGFGEIALLRNIPRTATVTALEACELLELTSERFLAAVTSRPDGSALARDVTDAHLARDRAGR